MPGETLHFSTLILSSFFSFSLVHRVKNMFYIMSYLSVSFFSVLLEGGTRLSLLEGER